MNIKEFYIVANTRNEFKNESVLSMRPYNDHPSYESIEFVTNQLIEVGFNTKFFGGIEKLIEAYHQKKTFPNSLFLNFSDGMNQASRKAQSAILLELLGVPYAGSDPLARLIAGNKRYAKKIVAGKLQTPKGFIIFDNNIFPLKLNFPVIVKPNREGSSIGITQQNICKNKEELQYRISELLYSFDEILIEEYIQGYEITCFVIGNKQHYYLNEPIICEYDGSYYFENFIFGIEEKASRKRKEYLAKEFLPSYQIQYIQQASQIAFEMLGMHDFARIDFRLNKNGILYFIEVNGNAVISETSEIGIISKSLEVPFGTIVGNIINSAMERLHLNRD